MSTGGPYDTQPWKGSKMLDLISEPTHETDNAFQRGYLRGLEDAAKVANFRAKVHYARWKGNHSEPALASHETALTIAEEIRDLVEEPMT